MPTYEYECRKCGDHFELFQNIKDEPRKRCSKCRGKVVRLLGTGAGLIFKGSGFYTTDYRSESYKNAAKKDAPSSPAEKSSAPKPAKESTATKTPASTKDPK